jgi:lipid-binding SYLF domain-containing protein
MWDITQDLNAAVAYFCNLSNGIFKGISLEGIGAKCQLDHYYYGFQVKRDDCLKNS